MKMSTMKSLKSCNDEDNGGYHSKVGKAVAGVEASTIAWLTLPARLIIIIIHIDEEDGQDEEDVEEDVEEDEDDGEDHDHDDLVTNKVFSGLHTFLTVRALRVWAAKLLPSCQQIFLPYFEFCKNPLITEN